MNTTAKPKHTPGPWEWADDVYLQPVTADCNTSYIHTILVAEEFGRGYAAHDYHETRDATEAEDAANRALMAASPDLLSALKIAEDFMSGFEDDASQDDILEKLAAIRAAIAKAEGRS